MTGLTGGRARGAAKSFADFRAWPKNADTGAVIGSSRYYDWNEKDCSIIVGYTFLSRAYWGTGMNRIVKGLMLESAFQRAERVWFQVSAQNLRSQRALEKIGAVYSHEEAVWVAGVLSPRHIFKLDRS